MGPILLGYIQEQVSLSPCLDCSVIDVDVSFNKSQFTICFSCDCVNVSSPAHVFADVNTQVLGIITVFQMLTM